MKRRSYYERPLPRFFPPNYFDKWFWSCVAMNVGFLAYDAWALSFITNDMALLATSGAAALQIVAVANFARVVARHSREWRARRPQYEADLIELERMRAESEAFIERHIRGEK